MNKKEAYDLLIKEYLSKCHCCDECIAEIYCIENDLREARIPQSNCDEKIKAYFKHLENVGRVNK